MYKTSKHEEALERGLLLDHIDILLRIHNKELITSKKMIGFKNLLKKRGYLDSSDKITELGMNILTLLELVTEQNSFIKLKESLSNELNKHIGKKQIIGFGNVYFIPTVKELEEFLNRFWKQYPEMKDINRISLCLRKHIERCCKENKFSPAVKYYITKDKTGSQLASAYEMYESIDEDEKSYEINL